MKRSLFVVFLFSGAVAFSETPKPAPTLKSVLLEQLRTTHNKKENWFVPVDVAIAGLNEQQAKWKDHSGNHSVMELVNHLAFWEGRSLVQFKDGQPPKFDGNNDETFHAPETWDAAVKKLDGVMTDWEAAVESADDARVSKWATILADLVAHRGYHTGQMIYMRRVVGSWNPENGVK